jgi:hypothetical protein
MFRRIATLFRGFVSLFITGIEKQNPRALIEAEKENLRQQISRFNDNWLPMRFYRAADASPRIRAEGKRADRKDRKYQGRKQVYRRSDSP